MTAASKRQNCPITNICPVLGIECSNKVVIILDNKVNFKKFLNYLCGTDLRFQEPVVPRT